MPCRRLPPELWERVITVFIPSGSIEWEEEIPSPTTIRDLKSCSLVSQAFLFPAQSVLFRRIDFGAWAFQHRDVIACCHRLAAIFKGSPHLTAHVQSLSAIQDVEIFSRISNMGLSRLRDIDIGGIGGDLDNQVLKLVQNVIGESIRHLRFTDFYSLSSAAVIPILEKARHLEGLHFYECSPRPFDSPIWPRKTITQLSLNHSPDIAKWLIHPGFPLDLTGLIYADIAGASNMDVGAVLKRARGTINCLTFLAEDVLDVVVSISSDPHPDDFLPVQPMHYPALTHLRIALVDWIDILATFPIFAGITKQNKIQEILYTIHNMDDDPEGGAQRMLDFDAQIMALPLPALKRLEIRVLLDAPELKSGSAPRLTPQSLPLLSERGVLYFTTDY
ncbi:hypothetical protein C8R44DRAFT_871459 [Mycena epipterygia]|nr:hypothetical protein C8R44DRAFT_871459 [Mycena epipterygia]